MKKNRLFLTIFIILISFLICSLFFLNNKNQSSDSILYNNSYEYTSDSIKFFIKERGYDFVENYGDKDINILKKELLIALEDDEVDVDYLYYEIYDADNLLIRGILYPENEYYYSNITIDKMAAFGEKLKVKILDNENNEIHHLDVNKKVDKWNKSWERRMVF